MNTVIGILATKDGIASDPTQRRSRWSTPAAEIRAVQPAYVPVDVEHTGDWCGEVVHLERDERGSVWCLAQVEAAPAVRVRVGRDVVDVPSQFFFSIERTPFDTDILVRSVSLTRRPARLGARPVVWYEGGLSDRGGWHTDWSLRPLITRAAEANYTRHGRPLTIHNTNPMAGFTRLGPGFYVDQDGEPVPISGATMHVRGGQLQYSVR